MSTAYARAAEPSAAIFNSTEQALHVSFYVISLPARQKNPLRMALIQMLESMSGLTRRQQATLDYLYGEKSSTVDFSGLSGEEIRAQCSMVIGAVNDHLQGNVRYATWLRYARGMPARPKTATRAADPGVPPSHEWKRALLGLARSLQAETGITNRDALCCLLAAHAFPNRRETEFSYARISAEYGIPIRTLGRAAFKIRKALRQLENEAVELLTPMFMRDGLIGCAEDR